MKKGFHRMMAYFSEVTELPLSEMCKEYSVNLQGRHTVTVEGVLSICLYERELIILEVCGDTLHIKGQKLVLKSFYQATLCIGGLIKGVEVGEKYDNKKTVG